ncbi:lysoplasmalogenase [uncultured Abyssibacter sp.]|uniref:lysoplasmalogenase n=1 Tax=uncultured Abyssibacter sp. TaxID=2320202 RepID=UPI0032B24001
MRNLPVRALGIVLGAALLCLGAVFRELPMLVLLIKPIPALVLAATIAIRATGRLRGIGTAALLCCALGDLILEGRYLAPDLGIPWFALGLSAFLIAHVLFILAFLTPPNHTRWWPAIAVGVYAALFLWVLWPKLGALTVPVLVYIAVISLMIWRALCVQGSMTRQVAIAGGALLFACSDSLIAVDRFLMPFDAARYVILTTYWLALVSLTIGLLDDASA